MALDRQVTVRLPNELLDQLMERMPSSPVALRLSDAMRLAVEHYTKEERMGERAEGHNATALRLLSEAREESDQATASLKLQAAQVHAILGQSLDTRGAASLRRRATT
jgi:metal-responsive CopG/Arc/MetJ family transcriptional regulator